MKNKKMKVIAYILTMIVIFQNLYTLDINAEGETITLTYDTTVFEESASNDGSISSPINLTLNNDTFTGEMKVNTHYTIANVPEGLEVVITVTSATTATIHLTKNAADHEAINSVSNFTITFLDAAFTSNSAAGITNAVKDNLEIRFYDTMSITYDKTEFVESPRNDGTTDTIIALTLSGDTFTGTIDAELSDTTVNNVPAGMTSSIVKKGDTTAELTLSSDANDHTNVNDVNNLQVVIGNGAFTSGSAAHVKDATKNLTINFNDPPPSITYSTSLFTESVNNDGSISGPINLTLNYDTFTVTSGTVPVEYYSTANVPEGFTVVITAASATTATIHLTSNADNHEAANSVSNFTITFLDAAFTSNSAAGVANAEKNDLVIKFYNPMSISYDTTEFLESPNNDGSTNTSITLTLTGDNFTGSIGDPVSGAAINNVPAGMSASLVKTGEKTAELTLSNNAISHEDINDVGDLEVVLGNEAFECGSVAHVENESNLTVNFRDAQVLTYSTNTFAESGNDDGSISNTIELSLANDAFNVIDLNNKSNYYTVVNVPAGLSVEVETNENDATKAEVRLSGNANSHYPSDNITDMQINFKDAAFVGNNATAVTNAANYNLSVNFIKKVIGGFNGTSVDYDETDGTPVLAAPGLTITDPVSYDENSYIMFTIDAANTYENLGVQRVSNPSTVNGQISFVDNLAYLGNGTSAESVGSIDLEYNGQNGKPLKINFSRSLENAGFLKGNLEDSFNVPGWDTIEGTYKLADLNQRTLGRAVTGEKNEDDTYTVTGPSNYTFNTDVAYGHVKAEEPGWDYEGVERPTGTPNTDIYIITDPEATGGRALKFEISGNVISDNSGASDSAGSSAYSDGKARYGSHFGPVAFSTPFEAKAGDSLALDWKAVKQSDHYEVYGYLENVDNSTYTLLFYGRGANQDWTTATATIPEDGNYRFMFINGTYDATGLFAVGSHMWIDNIRVYGQEYNSPIVQGMGLLVTYESMDPDPASTRTLNLEVKNKDAEVFNAASTININNQYNHPPTGTATNADPAYHHGSNAEELLFTAANMDTIENEDRFVELQFTVSGLQDGENEIITVDGTDIKLTDGNSGSTGTSNINFSVSEVAGTATVTLISSGLANSEMNALINGLKYKNVLLKPSIGNRTVTLTYIRDNGGSGGKDDDDTALSISSTVTVTNEINDLTCTGRTATTADFTWTAPSGAASVKIQQSIDEGITWTDSTHGSIAVDATSAQVTGLAGNQAYKFRLVVIGGDNTGATRPINVAALSDNTLISSEHFTVSTGQSDNETLTLLPEGTSKADFLSYIVKGHNNQTISTDDLSDPVEYGDTIVVTAENGINKTTYTYKEVVDDLVVSNRSYNSLTLQWTAIADAVSLQIQVSSDNGATWNNANHDVLAANASEATITGLSENTEYMLKLTVTGGALEGVSNIVSGKTLVRPTPSSNQKPKEEPQGVEVIVNGQSQVAAKEEKETDKDGKLSITLDINEDLIEDKIDELKNEEKPDENIITLPATDKKADKVTGKLDGDIIKKMEENDFTLEVDTGEVSYFLPSSEMKIDEIAEELAEDDFEDIQIEVIIEKPNNEVVESIKEEAIKNGQTVVFEAISFEVKAKKKTSSDEESVSISKFNSYVQRLVRIPEGIDYNKITTGIVLNADGTFSHIPTEVVIIDGIYYAKLNSLTNSTYSVIWNPEEIEDVANHWSKEAVNDMASRLVIEGYSDGTFKPDNFITRGEFATVITKALGIYRTQVGIDKYKDVINSMWYYDSVSIADEYGLIKGYGDNSYRAEANITREEAMAILARAIRLVELETVNEQALSNFIDNESVADWAKDDVLLCVQAEVIVGNNNSLRPDAQITRAEAAAAVRRLLQKGELINK